MSTAMTGKCNGIRRRSLWPIAVMGLGLWLFPWDAEAAEKAKSYNALNTFWVLFAAFMVFFMQAGFGMVEAGLIRAKNAANILMPSEIRHQLQMMVLEFSSRILLPLLSRCLSKQIME